MTGTAGAMAGLVLMKHARAEIERLDEKARMMRDGCFDERAAVSDAAWRERNARMLDTADELLRKCN